MSKDRYNQIYRELVKDNKDAVGMFAYALYKQQKIAFVEKIEQEHGRPPSDDELTHFHQISRLPLTIASYREQGEILVSAFLTEGLAEKVIQIQNDVADSVIGMRLQEIKDSVNAEKTWKGWFMAVLENLSVNLLTILVIGAIILGYQSLSHFWSTTETKADVTSQPDMPK